ncbi:MAG: hypothetical protein Q4D32_09465, partial [Eubacteriales bacterium]|nr:hypothetical protein [Eubacteriales bacterium]
IQYQEILGNYSLHKFTELILIIRPDKFGASNEKTPTDAIDDQLSLSDEVKVYANASVLELVR